MNRFQNKTVIIVCGPTASGKTAAGIKLAKYFNTEIISADSRQCYKELNIGVARPSEEELKEVTHHFIASHSIHEKIDAAYFENYALSVVNNLFKENKVVVMAGGSGLYINAFCEGLDEIPAVPEVIRKEIIRQYELQGIEGLQKEIEAKDPVFFKQGEIHNPQRLMRALEVKEATGKSIFDFRKAKKIKREFDIIKIGLELPKEILQQNINIRVDSMIATGLLEEVKQLQLHKKINALQTVGYKELFKYMEGEYSLEEAIEKIKTNTRRYAKRQMTWFRKDKSIQWFSSNDIELTEIPQPYAGRGN